MKLALASDEVAKKVSDEIDAVCVKYNVVLRHEDGQGCAHVFEAVPDDYINAPGCHIDIRGLD